MSPFIGARRETLAPGGAFLFQHWVLAHVRTNLATSIPFKWNLMRWDNLAILCYTNSTEILLYFAGKATGLIVFGGAFDPCDEPFVGEVSSPYSWRSFTRAIFSQYMRFKEMDFVYRNHGESYIRKGIDLLSEGRTAAPAIHVRGAVKYQRLDRYPFRRPLSSVQNPGWLMLWLVVWNIFYFSIRLGMIIPIDFHIFQMGGSTTNQCLVWWWSYCRKSLIQNL